MEVEKILKKEGIELISTVSDKKVKTISEKMSKKICQTFPEHNINQNDLYSELSKIKMYFADFNTTNSGAKYYYRNHSMYFNRKYNKKKLSDLATHECIHFIQEKRTSRGTISRYGLYNLNSLFPTGSAINEAAVQLMTVKINKIKPDFVKYYGLNLYTPSPDYYPIECALLNQIKFFIGEFPIFHSTLYSDDVFKKTFSTKTNYSTYRYIENSFDLIANYEDKLSSLLYTLSTNNDEFIAQKLNSKIEILKENISKVILETQERIIKECFNSEYEKAKDLEDLDNIKTKLLNFKEYLIQNENYDFYNIFQTNMLGKLTEKENLIKKYGIGSYSNNNQYLPILVNKKYGISLFYNLFSKMKKIFQTDKNQNLINNK